MFPHLADDDALGTPLLSPNVLAEVTDYPGTLFTFPDTSATLPTHLALAVR